MNALGVEIKERLIKVRQVVAADAGLPGLNLLANLVVVFQKSIMRRQQALPVRSAKHARVVGVIFLRRIGPARRQ